MCELCETAEQQENCPFDSDEKHPDQWTGEKPRDSNDRRYNPYQGSRTPADGRCGAPLSAWSDRYGEVRYCTALPESTFVDDGSDYCRNHKQREGLMKRASELLEYGLYSTVITNVFEQLAGWQKVLVLGFYDSYLQESTIDFDEQIVGYDVTLDGDEWSMPIDVPESTVDSDDDGNDVVEVGLPVPSKHGVRAYALYRAAIKDVQVTLAETAVMPDDEDGTTALETSTLVESDGEFRTTFEEHHLNLPIDRVDRSRSELLEFGGVPIESDDDVNINVAAPESLMVDLNDDATAVDSQGHASDPNMTEQGDVNPLREAAKNDLETTELADADDSDDGDGLSLDGIE